MCKIAFSSSVRAPFVIFITLVCVPFVFRSRQKSFENVSFLRTRGVAIPFWGRIAIPGTAPRFLCSRLSAVHFLCFKRIFSAQVWRCYSILGSSCVLVERSGVFFVSLELSSRRRAPFGVFLTFLVFVVWCPIAVFFAPVR